MSNILKTLAAGSASSEPTDEYFNQTTLLLHGDGTNGAQNNTCLDSSTNNFTITRNGNTTQGTFSPFSGPNGYWSNYFDGASDYLTTPVSANLALGGSDFCIEWWEYRTSIADFEAVMGGNTSYVSAYDPIIAWLSGSDVICYLSSNGSAFDILNAFDIGTATANQWIHRALTRDGNTFRGFENGVLINTTTASGSVYMSANSWRIGQGQNQGANTFPGYISSLRMSIGSIPTDYQTSSTTPSTSIFTPSTSPLTTSSQGSTSTDVELLTCQSNRFIDNSSNGFTITPTGNVAIQPFSPFAPSAAYSPSVNGGSGYFDGTGDYLLVADGDPLDVEASNFTLEFFYYPLAVQAAGSGLVSKRATSGTFGAFIVYFGGANLTPTLLATNNGSTWGINTASSQSFILNQWNHCAVTRSGDTWKLFVNGVAGITATLSGTVPNNTAALAIGASAADGSFITKSCYLSGLRLLKGTAIDFAATGVPTAPPTSDANTSLLLNFTNAGIFDNTGKNNLETVGNAQIDTGTKKYGTGSMEFDGTTDYLKPTSLTDLAFGTGDFTIEFWLYLNTASVEQWFVAWTGPSTCTIYFNSGTIRWFANGVLRITGASLSATTWYHIALTRENGSTKLFVDGTQSGSTYADTNSYVPTAYAIGATTTGTASLNGYIDDLRITKGVARYTTTFTPPTAPFPDQ